MNNIIAAWLVTLVSVLGLACADPQVESSAQATPAQVAAAEQEPSPGPTEASPEEDEATVEKDVPFVPSPEPVVEGMLDLARVGPDDVVYDLGSGDGRTVIAAAKRGARAVGIEIDPAFVERSRAAARAAGVEDRTEFRQQDFYEADLGDATVVTMYLLPDVNLQLRPKLLQLDPGTRLVSHSFTMGEWEAEQQVEVEGKTLYLWTVPARSSGAEGPGFSTHQEVSSVVTCSPLAM